MNSPVGEMIASLKGTRSYEQLSRDCGGVPTSGRIQQLATKPQNTFPSPESIQGLSRGLGVRPEVIVQACGAALGLWEPHGWSTNGVMLPESAKNLTPTQRGLVVGMVRELSAANEMRGVQAGADPSVPLQIGGDENVA